MSDTLSDATGDYAVNRAALLRRKRLKVCDDLKRLARAEAIVNEKVVALEDEAAARIQAALRGKAQRARFAIDIAKHRHLTLQRTATTPERPPLTPTTARSPRIADNYEGLADHDLAHMQEPRPQPLPPTPRTVPRTGAYAPRVEIPFDRDAARIAALGRRHAQALAAVEAQMGYVEEYPDLPQYRMKSNFNATRVHYLERFTMLTFATMNRCPPLLVIELFEAAGMLSNQAAVDHLLSLVNQMYAGTSTQYRAYCMESKAWEMVSPPQNRSSWLGGTDDWSSARTKLKDMRRDYHTGTRKN